MTRAPSTTSTNHKTGGAGVKETVESVLIAFILAFMFRAFVVEAFVIPTGSMATTLLGAHIRFDCGDCGWPFEVNFGPHDGADETRIDRFAGPVRREVTDWRGQRRVVIENRVFRAPCPNCGYLVSEEDATNPPVHYGDRILVLKYLYLFQEPQRWDVVVFKSPADPERYRYEQNYIKRLIGRPGEQVMLLDGDVYVRTAPDEPWQIQRKPRAVQEALWRIVHDNDHHPRGLPRRAGRQWRQPWRQIEPHAGWLPDPSNPRFLRFENMEQAATLRFHHEENPETYGFSDWLVYSFEYVPGNQVRDVKLSLHYQRESGGGPLRLRLSKLNHTFTAEVTPDQVRLLHGDQIVDSAAFSHRGPVEIEFMNVDYEVTLRIEGRTLIQHRYEPDVDALLDAHFAGRPQPPPVVEIQAERQIAAIRHLSLWRDIYYIARGVRQSIPATPFWGSPEMPIPLGEDEYYVLGDNAVISGDSRHWHHDVRLPHERLYVESGRVPKRFMLGKAFFVYWPGGYRPLDDRMLGIVPNFGNMRFIH